jgi:GR25 family glycosyltransferase involved in LPS biosynthesis
MKKISIVTKLLKEKGVSIFIINYSPLKDRRKYLKERISALGLQGFVSWIIQKPRQYDNIFDKVYQPPVSRWKEIIRFVDGPKHFARLSNSELNLILNHLEIYKKIVKKHIKFALILEDDVILEEDFLDRLIVCINNLPKSFDVAYTDMGMHLRLPGKISQLKFYKYNGLITRTTASYFITLNGAKKFLKNNTIVLPTDLNMRYLEKKYNFEVYWLNGYLTYQGSVYGNFYKTVLQKERQKPNLIERTIFTIEGKRFDEKFSSKLQVLLLDYLLIIPYRTIRLFLKNIKTK